MTEPVVTLEKVFFSYSDSDVLHDVSFTVEKGEFVGVIGPNGGGKTTLLKLIMGFLAPSKGRIKIFGKSPQQALQQIAYVPQKLHFDKEFPISVLELVLGGRLSHLPWYGKFHAQDKKKAQEALERVGLSQFEKEPFGNLSGGQAQRALIARALASEPELLLLDEPTASVDAQAETDIYQILKSLREKMTIMMVTHNLKTAMELVQRVLCVQSFVVSLEPQEVCKHFAFGLYHPPLLDIGREEAGKSKTSGG